MCLAGEPDLTGHAQHAILQVLGEVAAGKNILQMRHAGAVEEDLALNAGLPPVVLVLDEAGVGPLYDHCHQLVAGAVVDQPRHVELVGGAGVLADTHGPAIDINIESAFTAAEMQHHATTGPVCRHAEGAAVDTGRVFVGHVGRQVGKRHHHIGVLRAAESLHGPVAGHGDGGPAFGAEVVPGDVFGTGLQFEIPLAVERLEPRRALAILAEGRLDGGEWIERSAWWQLVQAGQLWHFPGLFAADLQQREHRSGCDHAGYLSLLCFLECQRFFAPPASGRKRRNRPSMPWALGIEASSVARLSASC